MTTPRKKLPRSKILRVLLFIGMPPTPIYRYFEYTGVMTFLCLTVNRKIRKIRKKINWICWYIAVGIFGVPDDTCVPVLRYLGIYVPNRNTEKLSFNYLRTFMLCNLFLWLLWLMIFSFFFVNLLTNVHFMFITCIFWRCLHNIQNLIWTFKKFLYNDFMIIGKPNKYQIEKKKYDFHVLRYFGVLVLSGISL